MDPKRAAPLRACGLSSHFYFRRVLSWWYELHWDFCKKKYGKVARGDVHAEGFVGLIHLIELFGLFYGCCRINLYGHINTIQSSTLKKYLHLFFPSKIIVWCENNFLCKLHASNNFQTYVPAIKILMCLCPSRRALLACR